MHWQRFGCLALTLLLALSPATRADDAAARAVVEKGLKAAGGVEKVEKFNAGTMKLKGTFYGMGMNIPYTGEWAMQMPNRMRFTLEMEAGGQKITITRVFDGTKGWMKVLDMTMEFTPEQVAEAKHEMYSARVASLHPLLKEKEFKLSSLGESQVEKQTVVGVKVSRDGQRDVNLYFDKQSGLVIKSETVVKDEESGKEVNQEEYYSDFKEIEGVKHPMRLVIKREGKVYVEGETTEFKVVEKHDDALFMKP